jgi:hypothetical protein
MEAAVNSAAAAIGSSRPNNRAPLSELPTFEDLNRAVDVIGEFARKYAQL